MSLLNETDIPGAKRWLVGGLVVAILLTVFLLKADDGLTYSDSEIRLKNTLFELRSAQAGLSTGEVDPRQQSIK